MYQFTSCARPYLLSYKFENFVSKNIIRTRVNLHHIVYTSVSCEKKEQGGEITPNDVPDKPSRKQVYTQRFVCLVANIKTSTG